MVFRFWETKISYTLSHCSSPQIKTNNFEQINSKYFLFCILQLSFLITTMTSVTAAECIECNTRPLNIVLSFMLILDIQIIKEQQILFPYTINQLMPFHSHISLHKIPPNCCSMEEGDMGEHAHIIEMKIADLRFYFKSMPLNGIKSHVGYFHIHLRK